MYRSLAAAIVAILFVSAPVAAQSSLWSATMTTGRTAPGEEDTLVGYYDLSSLGSSRAPFGALSDVDFEFQATTRTVLALFQHEDNKISILILPALSEQDFRPLTLTADDQSLVIDSYQSLRLGPHRATAFIYSDPGFRWTVGQRVTVGLLAPTPTPALPLVGVGLLAFLLGVGAYRRVADRS